MTALTGPHDDDSEGEKQVSALTVKQLLNDGVFFGRFTPLDESAVTEKKKAE